MVSFEFTDGNGRVLDGSAVYVIVNTKSGKPIELPLDTWKAFARNDGFKPELSSGRLQLFELAKEPFVNPTEKSYEVAKDDIDFYDHVSSAAYLSYVERLFSEVIKESAAIGALDVQFLSPLTGVGSKFKGLMQSEGPRVFRFRFETETGQSILSGKISLK